MSVEDMCLKLLRETNKPYNVQGVSDMLASKGAKKTQVDKALVALAEQGKIMCKEFGKTKIFFPSQEGLAQLEPEEKAAKLQEIKELGDQVKAIDEAVAALKRELSALNAALTLEQIQDKFTELQKTADDLDKKLSAARSGAQQISAADVTKVESSFSKMMEAWAKRRRIFNNLWDAVSENMDGKQSALFEDIGIETDEAVGEVLSNYQKLLQQNKRLKK